MKDVLQYMLDKRDQVYRQINKAAQNKYPSGSIVSYKRGTMTGFLGVKVICAWGDEGTVLITVRNLRNRKMYNINYEDLHPGYK